MRTTQELSKIISERLNNSNYTIDIQKPSAVYNYDLLSALMPDLTDNLYVFAYNEDNQQIIAIPLIDGITINTVISCIEVFIKW